MLFVEKYRPKKLDDIIGHDQPKQKIKGWILNWMHKKPRKPLLIYGPSGIGKTALAHTLAEEFDLSLVELNASMLRNKAVIQRVLSTATQASSLYGKMKLLVVDDTDIFERSDRGGVSALTSLLRNASKPFLLTAINPWNKKLSSVRMLCELIQLRRPSTPSIKKLLGNIASKEKLPLSQEDIEKIAENANGDVRSALNDLQAGGIGLRDREQDIFHQLRTIFKSTNWQDAADVSKGNVDYNMLKLWVDENIPHEYETPEDLANAFNCLSRLDVFEGRIKKSRWILLRYCYALLTAGIALSKKEPYRKFTKYQFPTYLKKMGASVIRRALRKSLCAKIGAKTHTSIHDAQAYLPLLQSMASKDAEKLAEFYELKEEELAYLLDTSVKKVKKR